MRGTRASLLTAVGAASVLALRFRRRYKPFPVRVAGASMEPTLGGGDLLAVSPKIEPRIGDIVVVRSGETEMVKRLAEIDGSTWHLRGDNRDASTDLYAGAEDVAGVVIARYWPKPKRFR